MNLFSSVPFISQLHLENFIPSPAQFSRSAGSMFVAGAIGGGYGLIGRVIYPNAGISPFHYAIWFTVAYQIKYCINLVEDYFETFMKVGAYLDELEEIPEDELDFQDQIRTRCWKLIQLRNHYLQAIDRVFSDLFHIRPYADVTVDNVMDASFLEMCRFRIWRVFKSTILEFVSFSLAYRLTNHMGFTLPSQTSIRLFIVIQTIVKDILLIPALYLYVRFCDQLADDLGVAYRLTKIRGYLPAL